MYIKDMKRFNGTFINGERLPPEGLETDHYELTSDNIVARIYKLYLTTYLFTLQKGTTTMPSPPQSYRPVF
jgi:hypothetical protein